MRRCNGRPTGPPRSRSACALARESAHVTDGVSGAPLSSSPIRLCMAVLNDSPRTRPSHARATSATVCRTASRSAAGSCSA